MEREKFLAVSAFSLLVLSRFERKMMSEFSRDWMTRFHIAHERSASMSLKGRSLHGSGELYIEPQRNTRRRHSTPGHIRQAGLYRKI